MRRRSTQKPQTRPSWCQRNVKHVSNDKAYSIVQEEVYLRGISARYECRRWHARAQSTLHRLLRPVHSEILQYIPHAATDFLPIVRISNVPCAVRDMWAMTQGLVQLFFKSDPSICTVWLQPSQESESNLIREVIRQCLQQASNNEGLKKYTTADWYEWAEQETTLQTILVMVHDDRLLPWLAQQRCKGFPIVAVLLSSSKPIIHSQFQYSNSTSFPSTRTWWRAILEQLVTSFPLPLDMNVLHDTSSVVNTLQQLQHWLTSAFGSAKGSFWWLSTDNNTDSPRRRRIDWFQRDFHGRAHILDNTETTYAQVARQRLDMRSRQALALRCQEALLMLRETGSLDAKPILSILCRQQQQQNIDQMKLIVLIDKCNTIDEARYILSEPVQAWRDALKDAGVTVPDVRKSNPTTRRNLTSDWKDSNLSHEGILWQLVSQRVSITREDWLEQFQQVYSNEDSKLVFSCAVYALQLHGLVRERKAMGKHQLVYEKTVLVWSHD